MHLYISTLHKEWIKINFQKQVKILQIYYNYINQLITVDNSSQNINIKKINNSLNKMILIKIQNN